MNPINLTHAVLIFVLTLNTACAGFPFLPKSTPAIKESELVPEEPSVALVELQHLQYDGKLLAGRLLVGSAAGSVRVDRRLIAMVHVSVDAVFECSAGAPVEFKMIDVLAPRPHETDLLVLEPGYWYGKWIQFPLFSEFITGGPGPTCIDVGLSLRSFEGRPLGSIRIRAEQLPRPPVDGGTEAPPVF